MNKNDFISKISLLNHALSLTGKRYSEISVMHDRVKFIRENKKMPEYLLIDELYNFYSSSDLINTLNAKKYISGRKQSPAVAILNSIKSNSKDKSRIKPIEKTTLAKEKRESDESLFFKRLAWIIGDKFIQTKSINKPIKKSHIFFSKNYKDYEFETDIIKRVDQILRELNSNFDFSSESLAHFIDGMIINHPILKTRIIEFDEEQHFTPARKSTLTCLDEQLSKEYYNKAITLCDDLNYLNYEVLKKHRIKTKLQKIPSSFLEFRNWLKENNISESEYVKPKYNFNYLGGRIAQRAYYDTLRDLAHLSPKNRNLSMPIRFTKAEFEKETNMSFNKISSSKIDRIIKKKLEHYGKL